MKPRTSEFVRLPQHRKVADITLRRLSGEKKAGELEKEEDEVTRQSQVPAQQSQVPA